MRDTWNTRLGNLAVNLARVDSFSSNDAHKKAVEHVIEESIGFIAWTIKEVDAEKAVVLVALQKQLDHWKLHLDELWEDSLQRQAMRKQGREWSEKVLNMSGLLYVTKPEVKKVAEP